MITYIGHQKHLEFCKYWAQQLKYNMTQLLFVYFDYDKVKYIPLFRPNQLGNLKMIPSHIVRYWTRDNTNMSTHHHTADMSRASNFTVKSTLNRIRVGVRFLQIPDT